MKYSFLKINIQSPFPTTQCGHLSQTRELFDYHDPLFARVTAFKDNGLFVIHYSMDILAFDQKNRDELEEKLKAYYGEDLHVITSTTHTHYANNVRDERYVAYLTGLLYEETVKMEYRDVEDVSVTYQRYHTTAVGKSRISGYETGNEFLCLVRLYEKDVPFLTIIENNCHPTVLHADVPYFSAEYPGYVLRKLEEEDPSGDYTFLQGFAGDISSRFTRDGQDYEAMSKLAEKLLEEIRDLLREKPEKTPLSLSYKAVPVEYHHEFTPIDLSKLRDDLSEREKETMKFGQIMRAQMEKTGNLLFGKLIEGAVIVSLGFGPVEIVFFPNEIFSAYMDNVDLDQKILVSYSNGYGPYVLPIDFPYVTYEMFTDTLTRDTKEEIIRILKTI